MTDFHFYRDCHHTSTTISEINFYWTQNTYRFCKILCDILLSTAVNLVQLSFAEIVMLSWKEAVYIYESHRISCIRNSCLISRSIGWSDAQWGRCNSCDFWISASTITKKACCANIMPITLCFTGNAFLAGNVFLHNWGIPQRLSLSSMRKFCNVQTK